jgi:hypothetical protein
LGRIQIEQRQGRTTAIAKVFLGTNIVEGNLVILPRNLFISFNPVIVPLETFKK